MSIHFGAEMRHFRVSITLVHKGNIMKFTEGAVAAKQVTYDLHRQMEGATLTSCSGFGGAIVARM